MDAYGVLNVSGDMHVAVTGTYLGGRGPGDGFATS